MKITILGAGAYGLALGFAFKKNNNSVYVWSKFDEEINELKTKHKTNKLPGITIPEDFVFSTNMEECVKNSKIIVIAVPIIAVDSTIKELKKYISKEQHICIASKGIEQNSCHFAHQIVAQYINSKNISVISGPSFAIDVATDVPIGLAIAGKSRNTINVIKKGLASNTVKLRTSKDMIGIEICGAIKNIIAIASGMIEGMGLPESTQAFLITESIHDIKYLIHEIGGTKKTILTFAGVGDLFLTCTSDKSRNYTLGKMIGEKIDKEVIDKYIENTTIEGLYTLKSMRSLLEKESIKLPIINMIYSIIYKNEDCEELKKFLITKD